MQVCLLKIMIRILADEIKVSNRYSRLELHNKRDYISVPVVKYIFLVDSL